LCNKWFTKPERKNYYLKQKHTNILNDHLGGISYRNLASRHNSYPRKICSLVNSLTSSLKPCSEVTKELVNPANYSGNLITDGKYIPVKDCVPDSSVPKPKKRRKIEKGMVFITNIDYHTHDFPHFTSDLSENLFVLNKNFKALKDLNYPLKSLTCDNKKEIVASCLRYYPEAKIQLCLAHYSREIRRKLVVQGVKRTIKSLEKKLSYLSDDLKIPTRHYAKEKAVTLTKQIDSLKRRYQTLINFQDLMLGIIFAKSIQGRDEKLNYLENVFFKHDFKPERLVKEHKNKILKVYRIFKEDQKFLFTHLEYPELNIPTTTNLLEAINGHFEDRLTGIRGFESTKTSRNYFNALILQRRFKIFKSCRFPFAHLNERFPLEIVKAKNILKIKDNWVRYCFKKRP